MGMVLRRIVKEWTNLQATKPDWILSLEETECEENEEAAWRVRIACPEDTPYEGSVMILSIHFPPMYPFIPPEVVIHSPLYHPHFRQNTPICVHEYCWAPGIMAVKYLECIRNRIGTPDGEKSCARCEDKEIKELYLYHRDKYTRNAQRIATHSLPRSSCKSARSVQ